MKFILVHGSWQNETCWKYFAPQLINLGHEVECLSIPYGGNDNLSIKDISLRDCSDILEDYLKEQDRPVAIIAHSAAGLIAMPLAYKYTNLVSHIFYLAAYLPNPGQSLVGRAQQYEGSVINELLEFDAAGNWLNPNKVKDAFYFDCKKEIADWACSNLSKQANSVINTQLMYQYNFSTEQKRFYIFCSDDNCVVPQAQIDMAKEHQCQVIEMNAGHFPFLSQPKKLAQLISQQVSF